jgi:hypothetical protein
VSGFDVSGLVVYADRESVNRRPIGAVHRPLFVRLLEAYGERTCNPCFLVPIGLSEGSYGGPVR